jgi:hypothetical protein
MVFEFSKCTSDEMSSLPFPSRFRLKHMGEMTLLGKIIYSCGPCRFLLVHIWTLVYCKSNLQSPICFSKLLKDYSRAAEKKLNLSATFEYVLLVQRNLCSVVEVILKYYWRVFNVILNKSPISIISPICFRLKANTISQQRTILKLKKKQ